MPKQKIVVHSEKFLAIITGLFVAVLLISNIASTKVFEFLGLVLDGGTILFPLSYIFGDILTEVYGYRKSRKVIWIGFFSALLMSVGFPHCGRASAGSRLGKPAGF